MCLSTWSVLGWNQWTGIYYYIFIFSLFLCLLFLSTFILFILSWLYPYIIFNLFISLIISRNNFKILLFTLLYLFDYHLILYNLTFWNHNLFTIIFYKIYILCLLIPSCHTNWNIFVYNFEMEISFL